MATRDIFAAEETEQSSYLTILCTSLLILHLSLLYTVKHGMTSASVQIPSYHLDLAKLPGVAIFNDLYF